MWVNSTWLLSVVETSQRVQGHLAWLVQNSRQLYLTKSSPVITASIKRYYMRKKTAFSQAKVTSTHLMYMKVPINNKYSYDVIYYIRCENCNIKVKVKVVSRNPHHPLHTPVTYICVSYKDISYYPLTILMWHDFILSSKHFKCN